MHRNAYLLLALTTLFWGGNAVAGKLAVGHVSPMLLTTLRWGLAMAVMFAIGWPRLKADWRVVRQNLMLLTALGALGFTVFNMALYTALIYTTAINASIEQAGMPMLIFAANFMLFRLRVTWAQIVGFALSVAGVIFTASHGDPVSLLQLDVNFGDALMLIAVIVYAGYTVALRFRPAIHWQSLMIMLTATAFVTCLPFALAEFWAGAAIVPDAQGWAIVAYTVLFPSILAQVFYIRGVELIGANRAGLFINLVPIFGTLLSIIILGEAFYLYHALAMALVLGGIWLAEHSGRKVG
ncbi:MAG: DMT family transporter [Pseudaminobacter sp.]|nr:DMT family transporter [Pseudaminobacter sp.]